MSNEVLQIKLQFEASGNASDELKRMVAETQKLESEEERYQKKLKGRIQNQTTNAKVKEAMINGGYIKPPLTEEEKYHRLLGRRIDLLQQQKRLQEDLIRLGHQPAPQTEEEKYHARFSSRVKQMQENARMQQDLIRQGHMRDPAETKAEAKEQARRQRDEERMHQARRDRRNRTWIMAAEGRPGAAALNQAMPAGGMGAAVGMAAMTVVKSMVEHLSKSYEVANNPMMTEFTKNRELARSMPLGFGDAADWYFRIKDRVTGDATKMAKTENINIPQLMQRTQGDIEKDQLALSFGGRFEHAKAGARAWNEMGMRNLSAPGLSKFDRSTVRGDIQYQEEFRLLGVKEKQHKLQVELNRAKDTEVHAGKEVNRVAKELVDLQEEHKKKTAHIEAAKTGKIGDPARFNEMLAEQQALANQIAAKADLERQAREMHMGAKQGRIGIESQLRQSRVDEMQQKYQFSQEAEARRMQLIQGFGFAGPQGRAIGMAGFEMVASGKMRIEDMPPELMGPMMQLHPELAKKQMEKAEDRLQPQFNQLAARFPGEVEGKKLRESRAEQVQIQNQMQIEIRMDATKTAQELADAVEKAFTPKFEKLIENVTVKIRTMEDTIEKGAAKINLR